MNRNVEWAFLIMAVLFLTGSILPYLEFLLDIPYNSLSDLIAAGWIGSLISLAYLLWGIKRENRTPMIKWIIALNIVTLLIYVCLLILVLVAVSLHPLSFQF